MKTYKEMVDLFEQANALFLREDIDLFNSKVSERTLCGALMLHFHDLIAQDSDFRNYYMDVEYNRNRGGRVKTIINSEDKIVTINCDLILHSRGKILNQDNLIAIEMKKSTRCKDDKKRDRERLMALTQIPYDGVWPCGRETLPEHVCGYVLGVYYEINHFHRKIMIEYYQRGKRIHTYSFSY